MMKVYRQGDVLLLPLDSLPEHPCHRWASWGEIRIEGERQGHVHRAQPALRLLTAERPIFYIPLETVMTHPEHPPLTIPAGLYEVRTAREYGQARGID